MSKKWLPEVELEEIQRNLEDLYHGVEDSENRGEWFRDFGEDRKDLFMKDCQVVLQDVGKQSKITNTKSYEYLSDEEKYFVAKMSNVMNKSTMIKRLK